MVVTASSGGEMFPKKFWGANICCWYPGCSIGAGSEFTSHGGVALLLALAKKAALLLELAESTKIVLGL